ncbi:MAG: NAD-dependent epimerase/dehydratase family protein [Deltaproteobacteria bacterium]|nr:NAD-dependent epimerase/dehydratase family protein [Deltaproteobacteria bacterium]
MNIAVVTGSAGLIGSEAVCFFAEKGFKVVGIENDMRKYFFGRSSTIAWRAENLKDTVSAYEQVDQDIRNQEAMDRIFRRYGTDIKVIIHTAAQPSHDWAAKEPMTDFTINANGTLILLEMTRSYCPEAVFIFTSTNKVYGDAPNRLPLVELDSRWELNGSHPFARDGVDESMSIDQNKHSLFGVSKTAADLLVQEYGRYFGMKTVCFRGGCISGSGHSGAELHGFLAYMMKCAITKEPYRIFGYKGKQVRDNIHSRDLVNMFWHFYLNPRIAAVYNAGGSRFSNCSIHEAIDLCNQFTGNKLDYAYSKTHRKGDHIWWISNVSKFKSHYHEWDFQYSLEDIFSDLYVGQRKRLKT